MGIKVKCDTKTSVWVKPLLSIPLLSPGQVLLCPTASSSAWLSAVCLPSSLLSTSVSTPLSFHSHMLSSLSSVFLYFCLTPRSSSSPPRGDICCCLHGTLAQSQTSPPSLLMAASSVLRTQEEDLGTCVYRPIGALVCKPHKGQVAQLSNMAPFYL